MCGLLEPLLLLLSLSLLFLSLLLLFLSLLFLSLLLLSLSLLFLSLLLSVAGPSSSPRASVVERRSRTTTTTTAMTAALGSDGVCFLSSPPTHCFLLAADCRRQTTGCRVISSRASSSSLPSEDDGSR